jgi:hypothetical protein
VYVALYCVCIQTYRKFAGCASRRSHRSGSCILGTQTLGSWAAAWTDIELRPSISSYQATRKWTWIRQAGGTRLLIMNTHHSRLTTMFLALHFFHCSGFCSAW